ncbi:MAG: S8 family serine peptidase, partial [Acidimicrobiia bacterium]
PVTYAATATVSGGADGPVITAQGISPTPALPPTPLIDGASAAAPGATAAAAGRCAEGALDPALVTGKVVLCRPENFLIGSAVLSLSGAAGGIFYQQQPRPFRDTWDVWLPSVIVSAGDAAAIRQLIESTPNPAAAFTAGTLTPTTTGDVVVNFSSRGAALGSLSILKPDLLAPGVDVIAAHTPEVPAAGSLFEWSKAERFRPFGGTSVSVPITAGAAALLLSLRPDFGPSEMKSALMTTAERDILLDAVVPSVPATVLDKGAGRMDPNRAADPGLVLTETTERFEDFIAAQVPTRDPSQSTIEATDLNLPSIAFDPLIGPRSTRRTFTSVDDQSGTWTASIEGLTGIAVTVSPAQFSIEPGQSRTVQFDFTPDDPGLGEYVDGAVVFTNDLDGRTVRLPVNLRPEVFEAPEQLNFGATQPAGRAPLALPTGYEGQLSALGYGLARGDVRRDQTVGLDIDDDDLNRIAQPGPGVTVFDLTVPADAKALAAELDAATPGDTLVDLDLFVFHDDEGDGFRADDLVDASETASQEALFFLDPSPGAYRISVRGVSADPVATFDLTTWVLDDTTPDLLSDPLVPGLQVVGDPVPVTVGGVGTLELGWAGLDEPGVYLGFVTFHDTAVPNPNDPLGEMVVAITRQ